MSKDERIYNKYDDWILISSVRALKTIQTGSNDDAAAATAEFYTEMNMRIAGIFGWF